MKELSILMYNINYTYPHTFTNQYSPIDGEGGIRYN